MELRSSCFRRLRVVLLLLYCSVSWAQGWHSLGSVTGFQPFAKGVEVQAGDARIRVVALSPSVVRVRYAPAGTFPADASWAVINPQPWQAPAMQIEDSPAALQLSTSELRVRIEKSPLRIVFLDSASQPILQEDSRHPVAFNGDEFQVSESMPEDERYFGLGDKAGPLDHRGQAFVNWNTDAYGWQEGTDPLYKSIPFFLGARHGRAYGVYLDNTWRTTFDFGKTSRDFFTFGSDGGELDYYFFYGPDPRKVISDYTALVGRTPLPPLFALGYQQCRYSYFPEARVRQIAQGFRTRKIPADVIYLDIDYQQDNRPFTVNRERFPNFEGMIRDLAAQNFKVVAITDLHLWAQDGYAPYDEGKRRDLFVHNADGSLYVGPVWPGPSVFPDFTLTPARAWWGTLYRDFVQKGIRGFWNDMNEPAVFVYPQKTMPLDVVHRLDGNKTASHHEIHNVFGMQNVRGTYEGLLKLAPDQRPFVLTRAAFAGTQRYAASWTGDNSSTWNHYRLSVPTLLNLGLSGYAFIGDDIGGFAGSPPPDLLTRWLELGVFNPLYRNHTAKGTLDQEPWVHGSVHEAIRRRYIELRYRLLPYIYTGMEETSRTGVPLMRPMFLEFPADRSLETNEDEFMFGPALLVAPKLTETLDPVQVRLPSGVWFDYWTGKRVQGGKNLDVKPALDEVPVFVRAGSIIPQQPVVQSTSEVPTGPLELRVYPGPDCRGAIYADDGETFAYQRGVFQRTAITCEATAAGVKVQIADAVGSYKPWWSEYRLTIVGVDRAPAGVVVDGRAVSDFVYSAAEGSVVLTVPARRVGISVSY